MQQKQGIIVSYLHVEDGGCNVYETTDIRSVVDTLLAKHGKFASERTKEVAKGIVEGGLKWHGYYLNFVDDKGMKVSCCLLPATINVK